MFRRLFIVGWIIYYIWITVLNGDDACDEPGTMDCPSGEECLGNCEIIGELCGRDNECPIDEICTNFRCITSAHQSYFDLLYEDEYDDDYNGVDLEEEHHYHQVERIKKEVALRMLEKGY